MSAEILPREASRLRAPARAVPDVSRPLSGGAVRMHVAPDAPLVGDARSAGEAFDALWSRLPPSDDINRIRPLPDHGLFLKGAMLPLSWALRHARGGCGIEREAAALRAMGRAGVPTPRVLAWGVEPRLGVTRRAVLATELVTDGIDLRTFLSESPQEPELVRELLLAAGRAVGRMHAAGIHHRDLSARNVVVRPRVAEVVIIDCPRAEIGGPALRTAFLRRSDRTRLARTVLRLGAPRADVQAMLEVAGDPHAVATISHALGCLRARRGETLRTRLWNILGV